MSSDTSRLEAVKAVIVETLGIEDRAESINAATGLFGSMPELDSLAVLDLMEGLESRFGLQIEDTEFSGEIFETVGSLVKFIDQKLADAR